MEESDCRELCMDGKECNGICQSPCHMGTVVKAGDRMYISCWLRYPKDPRECYAFRPTTYRKEEQ
jgi:hypothetical protein